MVNDLVRCDVGHPASTTSFPADQVTATAELVGVTGIKFLVTANPSAPREIPAGAYCGRLVTERAVGPYQTRNLVLLVSSRGGSALGMAALMVFFGALGGVFIRFLNDPAAKLISPYRRYRSLKMWVDSLAHDVASLERLRLRVQDIEDALWYLDAAAAEPMITKLEAIRDASDDATRDAALQSLPAPVARASDGSSREQLRRPAPRIVLFGIFRYYWLIGLIVVVLFVVAGGVWTQYFKNDAFAGSDRDWFSLLIFGLAAQVTTSTVAEAFFSLKPAARTSD